LVRALEIIEQTGTTPTEHRQTHPPATETVPLFVVDRPKEELELRIRKRVRRMLEAGLEAEAKRIQKDFPNSRALNSVGFRQILSGQGEEQIVIATRQLAKAQRTWFRGQHPEAQWFELDRDRGKLLRALDLF
jgi:tRNA dimethylallyltransferase